MSKFAFGQIAGNKGRPDARLDIMMTQAQHQCMRTTLTLDEDVAVKLKAESRRTGRPFREIVNDTLRRGFINPHITRQRHAFRITARDLGDLKPGLGLDNVAALLEQVEGSAFR